MKILILSVFTAYGLNVMANKLEEPDRQINCGEYEWNMADTCSKCMEPNREIQSCSGDCKWNAPKEMCALKEVSCGNHIAKTCAGCPQGNGEIWCNGECEWNPFKNAPKGDCVPEGSFVSCGGHDAVDCPSCSYENGKTDCNGDCEWNTDKEACMVKSASSEEREGKLGSEYELKFEEEE